MSGENELRVILSVVQQSVFEIATSVHGTRAMQTLVEKMLDHSGSLSSEFHSLCATLQGQVFELSTHTHGNHVIQALLVAFRSSDRPQDNERPGASERTPFTQFIFEACMQHCKEIGTHKHGCCVMQRCLEKGSHAQKMALADVIVVHLADLIEDPFGNYLVQNVLKLETSSKSGMILNSIANDFVRLSQLKFSSNVIEKCLESSFVGDQIDLIFTGAHPNED